MLTTGSQTPILGSQSNGNLQHFLNSVDLLRLVATNRLEKSQREIRGQFLTPSTVATLMAGMFEFGLSEISLLDAGSGIGSLLAAVVAELCQRQQRPQSLHITAYEIDFILIEYLEQVLDLCGVECDRAGIVLNYEIRSVDFIQDVVELRAKSLLEFTHAILNPPYQKINSKSKLRSLLRDLGVEANNLYTGFIAACTQLLKPDGELVAISPRSFCNGPYFRDFRSLFLQTMALQQIHLFDSRSEAFRDDGVLQETIIIHALKRSHSPDRVVINSSTSAEDESILSHTLHYNDIVHPDDPEQFIRIVPDAVSLQVVEQMARLTCSLEDIGLTVSTGRVVDFRAKPYLRLQPEDGIPLIYPVHFSDGYVKYPTQTKKHQALVIAKETASLIVPNEHYVLSKRFSSKEEKKRIVAVVYDATQIDSPGVGFENHLNYFHRQGRGLDITLAHGLAVYLNSSLVDSFFRLFNGHTQVNATDLRSLKYPTVEQLIKLGTQVGSKFPTQKEIDELVERELLNITSMSENNPFSVKSRIDEAIEVLVALGFPRGQLNERSALTLLAFLDLKPSDSWQAASSPLRGITPIMEFMAQEYGKQYKPNTRETVRRQTVHQFLDAGLIVANPDRSDRPVNSPKTVYQIEESALELLKTYTSPEWDKNLRTYLASVETLKQKYARERQMARIPILIEGELKTLSPGGQNILVEKIVNEFAPRFTPRGKLIYVGDTDEKFAHFNESALAALGVTIDSHGKMPDVIIHFTTKNWLVLIEAVTSHGPINSKRKAELEHLFRNSTADIVMVTAFLSRKAMVEYLPEISWETDVWVAEDETHLIHFNGEHLLQAYSVDSEK